MLTYINSCSTAPPSDKEPLIELIRATDLSGVWSRSGKPDYVADNEPGNDEAAN